MSVFHMHVDDAEQDHGSVYVLKPETDNLKPQRPSLATPRFKGQFGGDGGGVGDGDHAGVKPAGISRGAIQGMNGRDGEKGRIKYLWVLPSPQGAEGEIYVSDRRYITQGLRLNVFQP